MCVCVCVCVGLNRIAVAPVNAVVLICQWKCQEGLILTTGQRRKEIAVIRCNRGGRNAAGREGGRKESSKNRLSTWDGSRLTLGQG